MKRHFKIGLSVSVAVATLLTTMAVLDGNQSPGIFAGLLGRMLLAPSLPMIFCVVQFNSLDPDDS